jgi:methionyl-tRNA formyltransferase
VPLRIVFCGTPAFAVPALRHLIAQQDFQIESIVTQPDRPRGRGRETSSSPVKEVALEAGIAVFQPGSIRSEQAYEYFKRLAPDAVVIIAYGQIVPARLIELPRLGWINLHASLLPKYRGAAPINWAIVNGETRTGVTTMKIDAGLDTGPTLLSHEVSIGADETAPELSARLAEAGAPLMSETLRRLDQENITPTPQNESQATFAPLLKKGDGRIDWSLPAEKIYNRIRGLEPWPGTFASFRGKTCHIWGWSSSDAHKGTAGDSSLANSKYEPGTIITRDNGVFVVCGEDTELRLEFAQLEGRKRITARDFANGARIGSGERFR